MTVAAGTFTIVTSAFDKLKDTAISAISNCIFLPRRCSTRRLSYSKKNELITAVKVSNTRNIGCHLNYYYVCTIGGDYNRLKSRHFCCAKSGGPEVEDNSLINVLKTIIPSLKVFYGFSRPYACFGAVFGVTSSSLVAIESFADISLHFLIGSLMAAAAFGCINFYATGINQIFDIEIDKVNKPHFPLASGEMSIKTAIAITSALAVMGLTIACIVGSRPLLWGCFIYFIIFSAYSVNLPFLRWKKHEITAALTIIANRGIVLQISTFLHMQTSVLRRQANFSRPLIFGAIVVSIFSAVIALFKDIPDIEGDKKFGISSLAASLGQKQVFWICATLLEMVYIFAIIFGSTSSRPWSKFITIFSHGVLALILWKKIKCMDLKNKLAIESFYMLIWKALIKLGYYMLNTCFFRL